MKKPILKFTPMFYVPDWGEEIIEGVATPLNHKKNFGHYQDDYLFYPKDDTIPYILDKHEIFDNYEDAYNRFKREREKHIEYHKKQVERSSKFLAENNAL